MVLITWFAVGCAEVEPGIQPDAVLANSGILVDYEPLVRLGWGSTDPQFGNVVDGIVLDDSTAIVLDAQRSLVTYFFADGRSLDVGGTGQGPGEFAQLHAIVRLPNGAVAIQDAAQGRLVIIGSGQVIETLSSPALTQSTVLGITEDDRWITGVNPKAS